MLKALPLFIFTLFALVACGPHDSPSINMEGAPGIIGGKAIKSGDPFTLSVVALRDKSTREGVCTGTLLSSQIVLTAGHCVEDYRGDKISELEIVLGVSSWNRDADGTFTVQKITTNPVYADPVRHQRDAKIIKDCLDKNCGLHVFAGVEQGDIALILLQSPIPAKRVRPVILNNKQTSYVNGAAVLVAGYGMHDVEDSGDSGFLRSFQTRVYSTYKDFDVGAFKKVVIPSIYSEGSCVGDSGGPAFVKQSGHWVQVGIGQGSLELDAKNKFACGMKSLGYTDIASYLPWILKARSELEAILGSPEISKK